MKFYTKKRRAPVLIILPLIDILAILLIFFIVTSTFKKRQPQMQINLPDSKTATESTTQETEPILLRVRGAEEISIDERPVALPALAQALREAITSQPGRPLALQADREAAFGVVVQVLDALKEAGIKNIPAFTQPQNQTP